MRNINLVISVSFRNLVWVGRFSVDSVSPTTSGGQLQTVRSGKPLRTKRRPQRKVCIATYSVECHSYCSNNVSGTVIFLGNLIECKACLQSTVSSSSIAEGQGECGSVLNEVLHCHVISLR